jgi:putative inorganic carbon (hco3(-)) transporter
LIKSIRNNWVYLVGILFLSVNLLFTYKDLYFLNLLPIILLVVFAALFALDKLFLFVVFCTPLSLNLEQLNIGGIGMYLPTEPILFGIMLVFLYKQFFGSIKRDTRILNHPITLAILFNLGWIFITSLTSEDPLISFKFLLSRMWFIVPIYFFGIWFFRKGVKNMYTFLWMYIIPLTAVLLLTLVKHASHGFSEEVGHWIMSPFFKDHTSYGAVIALLFPIVVSMAFDKEKTPITRSIIFVILIIFSIALFYSSTRAAWVSVAGAGMVYLLFMFKIKFKYLFVSGLLIGSFIIVNFTEIKYMLNKNDAEHTTENFSEKLESMSNVSSDASNLERLNRWNCAIRMFQERPLMGWGPGVYSFYYAPFQDPADLTIISTNFGTGGNAHSEYLGPLAEQGILGGLSILILVIIVFYRASVLYIRLEDKKLKRLVMMLMLGLVTYFTHGVLNNYLDTDKASVPVWGFIAIIVALDIYFDPNSKEKENDPII